MTLKRVLSLFPYLALSLFFLPLLAALICTLLPAFGYWPAWGGESLSWNSWVNLAALPGLYDSLKLTILLGGSAAFLSLLLTFLLLAGLYQSILWPSLQRLLALSLALPHLFFALGLLFLASPSGWWMRGLAPLFSWSYPPQTTIFFQYDGMLLFLALLAKESLFLLFVAVASLARLQVDKTIFQGKSLGYHDSQIWLLLIWPQLYRMLRLPFYAALVYSLSVVDLPLVLGPKQPTTLSVFLHSLVISGRQEYFFTAAAGSLLLTLVVAVILLMSFGFERVLASLLVGFAARGRRKGLGVVVALLSRFAFWGLLLVYLQVVLGLLINSISQRWRFPDILPRQYTVVHWQRALAQAGEAFFTTLSLGVASTIISLFLVIGCLEYERICAAAGREVGRTLWLLYLPFLLPQLMVVYGAQLFLFYLGFGGSALALLLGHILFVLPYIFITLGPAYRGFDHRYFQAGQLLGRSWLATLLRVKLPLLAKPIAFAAATGFSVSVVQYLPTLYLGGGRFITFSTEAVSHAAGGDMRVTAVYGLLQSLLPLCCYGLLFIIFARRRYA